MEEEKEDLQHLQEELQQLQEEIECKNKTLNTYIARGRMMNEELEEARKAAFEVCQAPFLSHCPSGSKTNYCFHRSPSCSFVMLYQFRW